MCGNVLWGWGGLNNFLLVIIFSGFFNYVFGLLGFVLYYIGLEDLELLLLKSKESYVCLCFEGECELIIHFDGSSFFWHYRFFFDLAALLFCIANLANLSFASVLILLFSFEPIKVKKNNQITFITVTELNSEREKVWKNDPRVDAGQTFVHASAISNCQITCENEFC